MKILVIGNFELDSSFAFALNTLKMADGFAKLGHEVLILCQPPRNDKYVLECVYRDYDLSKNIKFCLSSLLKPRRFAAVEYINIQYLLWRTLRVFKADFCYARHMLAPLITAKSGLMTSVESHAYPDNSTTHLKWLVRGLKKQKKLCTLVTIAERLKIAFEAKGVPQEKIKILADAADTSLFDIKATRQNIGHKLKKPTITYTGQLFDYKGIPTILQAAKLLPAANFVLVGGLPEDIKRHQYFCEHSGIKNVKFLGQKPHSSIPQYLHASDILLLLPTLNHPSAEWTSPMKLAEYLSTGKPIIASKIPALLRVLKPNEVAFVNADDAVHVVEKIKYLLDNKDQAAEIGSAGKRLSHSLSFSNRCKQIIEASM